MAEKPKTVKKIKCAINFLNSKNVIMNNLDEPRIYVGKNSKKIKIHKCNYLSHFIIDLLPKFANFATFENFQIIFSDSISAGVQPGKYARGCSDIYVNLKSVISMVDDGER